MIALFFDTETTGFRTPEFTPEIVQIGAILQDTDTQRVLAELNLIVKTKYPIPETVSAIHGIDDYLTYTFGFHKYMADGLFATLVEKADLLVAHNIAFDTDIIDGAWRLSAAMILDKTQFCTMRELTEVMKLPKNGNKFHDSQHSQYKAPKLIEAYRYFFGKDFSGAHDAMADVRACRDVYFAMQQPTTEPHYALDI